MSNSRFLRTRHFAVLLLVLILAASVYAFAAANVVPTSGAGDGSNTISGYTVSNVTYDTRLAPDIDPGTIDQVSFNLVPAPGAGAATEVYVQLVAGSPTWFSCSAGVTLDWDCAVTGVTTLAADELRVVAAQ